MKRYLSSRQSIFLLCCILGASVINLVLIALAKGMPSAAAYLAYLAPCWAAITVGLGVLSKTELSQKALFDASCALIYVGMLCQTYLSDCSLPATGIFCVATILGCGGILLRRMLTESPPDNSTTGAFFMGFSSLLIIAITVIALIWLAVALRDVSGLWPALSTCDHPR